MNALIDPWTRIGTQAALGFTQTRFNRAVGFQKVASTSDQHKRMVLAVAADCIELANDGECPASRHLKLAAAHPAWSKHHDELFSLVARESTLHDFHTKHAFADVGGALAGVLGKGLGYGTVLGGAGLGALYTLLARHTRQDVASNEGLQAQIDHYRRLGHNMQRSMNERHQYQQSVEHQEEKPKTDDE